VKISQNNTAGSMPDLPPARADIVSAQGAGADARIPGENGPGQYACAGHAKVDTEPPDAPYIDILPRWVCRVEFAPKRLRGSATRRRGVGDARDGEHQRNNVGKLLPQKRNQARTRWRRLRTVVPLGVNLAHGSPTYDGPLLNVCSGLSPR
jgi:hypothetical protein